MKYDLILDEVELEYINQILNNSVDTEGLKEKKIALDILEKIASLKSISTFRNKRYITSSECFDEGIAGNCGIECKYYGFEGCEFDGN